MSGEARVSWQVAGCAHALVIAAVDARITVKSEA
jgi:hypothetical protein